MRPYRPILLSLTAALALAGCATQKRSEVLTNTLNAYASTVRWGDFGAALQFVDPAQRASHPLSALDRERYEQVRVTGYDEGNGPVPVGENEVQQVVQISLINNHTQTERSLVDRQLWRYDPQSRHWWLESGLPDITEH